jgi:hypothetical protein
MPIRRLTNVQVRLSLLAPPQDRSILSGESTMPKTLTDPHGDVDRMLARVRTTSSERQLRLFACGCCRQVWRLLDNPRKRGAVAVAERFADGQATAREMLDASYVAGPSNWVAVAWAAEAVAALTALTAWAAADAIHVVAQHAARALRDAAGEKDWAAARRRQGDLLCDIFDRLDPPAILAPDWLRWQDGTARKLAEVIYQEHRFADMPVLGDALEEAGCDRAEILDHCRQHTEHARGCWLIDAILGKR